MTDEEKQKELERRIKNFNAELMPLLKKYRIGIGAVPVILPTGTIGTRLTIFDDIKSEEKKDGDVAPSKE